MISGNAEYNRNFQCYACVEFFHRNRFNVYMQFRTLYRYICKKIIENYLETKPMHVFPLNLQCQKVLSDFFKKKGVETYQLHLMSTLPCEPPNEPKKYLKT